MPEDTEETRKTRQEMLTRMTTSVAACKNVENLKLVIINILTKILS